MKIFGRPSLFLLIVFFANYFSAYAQQYTLQSNVTAFSPLVGGTTVDQIENDQGIGSSIPLPFTFSYFGSNYNAVQPTAEGFLSFNNLVGANLPYVGNQINASTYLNIIAPLWDDLDGAVGAASHLISGSAPNRVFTFEWLNWRWSYQAVAAGISFQVRLHEGSNVIEFSYRQEAGALTFPSASTGLVGGNVSQFYSLSALSAAPEFSLSGVNNLSVKPADGQTYTFTPSAGAVLAPTIQAHTISTPQLGAQTATLAWINGNGTNHAVFVKQTSAAETVSVSDNAAYTASSSFASPSSLVSAGWYCVYNGNGSSVAISNLQSGFTYRVQVLAYNGIAGQQKYLTTTTAGNPVNVTTVLQTPQTPYSTLTLKKLTANSVTFDLWEGAGTKRVIFAKAGESGTVSPVTSTTYTASTNFGAGSQIGSSGWFCVFNGTSSGDITVNNLQGNTAYLLYVIDYNGPAGGEVYASPTGAGVLANFTTYELHNVPNYTFQASAGSFIPLSGGIPVDAIEVDDGLSSAIPIGFSFRVGAIPFTQLIASSNGFLSFNPYAASLGSGLSGDLDFGDHRPLVAPLWDDLGGNGGTGQASYKTEGTAPNRIFTFEWLNWKWTFSASVGISFQVKLHEANNRIEYIYQQEAGALASPGASIGIGFAGTGSGNFISLNNASASPSTSTVSETSNIAAKPAQGQVYSFTPDKLNQSISFPVITDKFFGASAFSTGASATSGLPVTLESSNENVATVSGQTVTLTGAGSVTITAHQSGSGAYNPAADVQRAFIVNKGDQAISFNIVSSLPYSASGVTLNGTSASTLSVAYESSNTSVATIIGNTLTMVGVGTTDITATQSGNANYNPATPVVRTLNITKGSQTITFPAIPGKFPNDAAFELTATSTSNLPVVYESSNTAVATVSGSTVTIVGAGTANITALHPGSANYNAAAAVLRTLTVTKRSQSASFTTSALPTQKVFGDAPFVLEGTATSGLPVNFVSLNTNVATVSGNQIAITGAGSATIYVEQPGNAVYNYASTQSFVLNVAKAEQTVTIDPVPDKKLGDGAFTVSATASSGEPVTLSGTEQISIAGNSVTINRDGLATIYAVQTGNINYNSKTVQVSFCISPTTPVIVALPDDTLFPSLIRLSVEEPSIYYSEYQWFKNGVKIQDPHGSDFSVFTPGEYSVVVASHSDCPSEKSEPYVVIFTGTPDPESLINIFPNPVDNFLTIRMPNDDDVSVAIVDLTGKVISTGTIKGNSAFSMNGISAGAYIVRLTYATRVYNFDVIKK